MKKVINILIIVILLIITLSNVCFAAELDAHMFDGIYQGNANNKVTKIIGIILGAIQVVGGFVAVIMLIYIGIMYMKESPQGKAETKQRLYPYIIGIILLFAGSTIFGIIGKWFFNINN